MFRVGIIQIVLIIYGANSKKGYFHINIEHLHIKISQDL